jgi:hypothetical protein
LGIDNVGDIVYILHMETTTDTYKISETEHVDVVRRESGDYVSVLRREGEEDQTRWANGSGEQGRKNANIQARRWAQGFIVDRRWMSRNV